MYVGISAKTAVSVLRQYLDVISATNTMPHSIRSDRGTETPMLANAHFLLLVLWILIRDSNQFIGMERQHRISESKRGGVS